VKVILLEDEHIINANIKEYLEFKELSVESYTDGSELLKLTSFNADIAILDIEVPGATGFEVIQWIKRVNNDIPIIFMTAYTDIKSIEKAYSLGCSDYLKKPFDLIELYLRVKQLLDSKNLTKIALTSTISFNIEEEQLYSLDEVVKLTKIQRKILTTLLKHKNSIVTYSLLMSEVWEDNYVKVNTIASHIKEIRKHLPSELIDSLRAEGYRINL